MDLDSFSHIIVLFHLHLSKGYSLQVIHFLDDQPRGVCHQGAKKTKRHRYIRSYFKKISINILEIEDVDMLDGTPLLDIKPYTPEFDNRHDVRTGWPEQANSKKVKSDKRFI